MAADLDSAFKAAELEQEAARKALDDLLKRQQADDRSAIAKVIVWAFVGLIAWVVIAATVGAAVFAWDEIAEPVKVLMTILSSVLLPVVTLVIGYYFGSK
jgi:hypothetical protein